MYADSVNSIVFAATWMIEAVIGHYSDKSQHIDNNKTIIATDDILKRMEEGRTLRLCYKQEKHQLTKICSTYTPYNVITRPDIPFYNELDYV